MTTRLFPTVEYPFDTRLTTLATNTTLGTATRHDFTSITLDIPVTTSRTFRSVIVVVTARDAETTTARRLDGCRIGIKLGAVAFDDLDLTGTGIANTGDPFSVEFRRDVTAYFATNFGNGTSQTCQVGVAFETDVASNFNNITAKVIVTYEADDATQSSFVKTVRIPLEGITGFLPTVANSDMRGSAGSGQIPQLTSGGLLPESSISIKHQWIEVYATDGGAATTDFNANYSVDSGATAARATLEQGLNGSVYFYDIYVITGVYSTTAAHDFEAWSSLASRFERLCAVMYVTYTYAKPAASDPILVSLQIPIANRERHIAGTVTGDRDVSRTELWIEEDATVAIKQSGVLLFWANGAAGNVSVECKGSGAAGGTQGTTTRTYTGTAFVQAGVHPLCHRIDLAHGGSALTLGRGKNILDLTIFASANNTLTGMAGFWFINYTCTCPSAGEGVVNRTTMWSIKGNMAGVIAGDGGTTEEIATAGQRTPNIPESSYWLNDIGLLLTGNRSTTASLAVSAEIASGELADDGWIMARNVAYSDDAEFGFELCTCPMTDHFKRCPESPQVLANPETARKYRLAGGPGQWSMTLFMTHHAITYAVAGALTPNPGAGITVQVFDANGIYLGSTTTDSSGNYSLTVYDNVTSCRAVAQQDSTHVGCSVLAVAA